MIKHRMGCFVAFFLLIFYKTEESVSVQRYCTRHGHTLSQTAHIVGQPSARQRNAIQNVLDVA